MTADPTALIALTMLQGVGDVLARALLQYFGTAEEVFTSHRRVLEKIPGIGEYTARRIDEGKNEALKRAEKEVSFIEKKNVRLYAITEHDYPKRLRECQDAPVVFYYKGKANLNATKIISIVGTRRATDYGRMLTERLVRELAEAYPALLIVSGLAYGIDICSHRSALKNGLSTVGVLAHGLDRIYPAEHRNTAAEMLEQGGLLTDFSSETNPDRENFLKRNRLIAGLSDTTVVVESAERGGALVTADIACSYGRDVYAFPGRPTDEYSAGCNRMIQTNKAGLITSGQDLIRALCWDTDTTGLSVKGQLKLKLEKPDHPIVKILADRGEMQINDLAMAIDLPVYQVTPMLFELELAGHVIALPGGMYKLTD